MSLAGTLARLLANTGIMTKLYTCLLFAVLAFVVSNRCEGQANIGALHIGAGTQWVATNETAVVLDRMDLQYDAAPGLLNNLFRFTGTGINSIRGDNRPTIYAIGVAKIDPGRLELNRTINVTKRINFESGYFNLNDSNIYLQPFALLTNENENSRIIGNFGGYITIDAELSSPVAANPGNLGAVITSATDLGKVTIIRGHDVQYLTNTTISISRWYDIASPAGAGIDATLRFTYLTLNRKA